MQANGRVARGYGDVKYLFSLPSVVSICGGRDSQHQEPIPMGLQLRHILVSAFSRTDLFLVWIILNSDPHRNLSDHDVDMFMWGRIVLFLPKCAHVDWNWHISREKYLKIDWFIKMPLHCDRTGLTLLSDVLPRKLFRLCGLCSTWGVDCHSCGVSPPCTDPWENKQRTWGLCSLDSNNKNWTK